MVLDYTCICCILGLSPRVWAGGIKEEDQGGIEIRSRYDMVDLCDPVVFRTPPHRHHVSIHWGAV